MRPSFAIRPRVAPLAVMACAAALVALAGCDKQEPEGVAIAKARNTLEALDSGGAAAPPTNRSARFSEAAKAVASITGSDPSSALAQALGGTAILGQAELAQAAYRETDGELLRLVAAARAKLNLYQRQHGLANALSNYDPQPEIDGYQQTIAQRNRELSEFEAELRANDAKIAELRSRAQEKSEQGRAMRESSASLERSLLSADSSSRPGLAEQVRVARRAADAVLKEADLFEVEAARHAPMSAELQLRVQQVRTQIAALEKAIVGARDRDETMRRQSAVAKSAAETAGEELKAVVEAVVGHVNEKSAPAFESAVGLLAQASSKLNAGRSSGGTAQSTSVGLAAHAEGAFRREHAEALTRVVLLLNDTAAATPAPPGATDFAQRATSFSEQRDAMNQSALEAYERATSSFATGGRGDTGERLQRLSSAIDAFLIERGLKKAPPAEAPAQPTEEPPAEDQADPAAPDESGEAGEAGEQSSGASSDQPMGDVPAPEPTGEPASEPAPETPPTETPPQR